MRFFASGCDCLLDREPRKIGFLGVSPLKNLCRVSDAPESNPARALSHGAAEEQVVKARRRKTGIPHGRGDLRPMPDFVEKHMERELSRRECDVLAAIVDFQCPVQIGLAGGMNEFHKLEAHGAPE